MSAVGSRRFSIKSVLIGSFVAVAALPIAFVSVQEYRLLTRDLLDRELESDLTLARAVAGGLERYVTGRVYLIQTAARDLAERPRVEISALTPDLDLIRRRNPSFTAVAVIDREGISRAFSPATDEQGRSNAGRQYADREWFRGAMQMPPRTPYEVVLGRVVGRSTVPIVAPMRSPAGQLLGVLAASLDLGELRESTRDVDPARSVRLVVVDGQGRVIVHSSREWEAEARDLSREEVFRAARDRREGTLEYASDFTGKQSWAAFVRVPTTGWLVWTARGPEALAASVRRLVRDVLVMAIIAVLIAAAAATLVGRWLGQPIEAFAGATRQIGARRFAEAERTLPRGTSRIAEFHQLTAGFREMAGALSAQYEELEARVAERTRALAEQTREAQATSAVLRAQEAIRRGYGELTALLNSLDRSYILEEGVKKIASTLHAPLAAVYLTENTPTGLRLKTYAAVDGTGLDTGLFGADGLPAEVARRTEPIVLALPDGATRLSLRTGVGAVDVAAVAGYPLVHQKRLLGALVVALLERPSEATRTFLESAARQFSVAISNAGLFESVRYQSQQLERLNDELRRASNVKSEFLASMSHELRTPLNSIIGFTELLLGSARDPLSERQRAALEKVLESGRHLLALINDVLDLSKIEAGRLEVRPEVVVLTGLVQECLAAIEVSAQAKGLAVRAVGLEAVPELWQDRGKIKQVLLNLLSNAVKFTEAGSIELRVDREGEDRLVIVVADTGIGVPPEDRTAIFDAFRRVDAPEVRRAGGTGLGLAISKRLAELMGGSLTMAPGAERGSVFTLRLPIRYGPPAAGEEPAEAAGLPADAARILVIDDDRNVPEIIRRTLADEPVRVEWAASATEGVERARRDPPAVILLDVILQGDGDGWEVLQTLKMDARTRDIPVLVHSVIDNSERARSLGASGVLPKPASPAAIRSRLRDLLPNAGDAPAGDPHGRG